MPTSSFFSQEEGLSLGPRTDWLLCGGHKGPSVGGVCGRGVCRARVQGLVNELFLTATGQQLLRLQAHRPLGCSPAVWSQLGRGCMRREGGMEGWRDIQPDTGLQDPAPFALPTLQPDLPSPCGLPSLPSSPAPAAASRCPSAAWHSPSARPPSGPGGHCPRWVRRPGHLLAPRPQVH